MGNTCPALLRVSSHPHHHYSEGGGVWWVVSSAAWSCLSASASWLAVGPPAPARQPPHPRQSSARDTRTHHNTAARPPPPPRAQVQASLHLPRPGPPSQLPYCAPHFGVVARGEQRTNQPASHQPLLHQAGATARLLCLLLRPRQLAASQGANGYTPTPPFAAAAAQLGWVCVSQLPLALALFAAEAIGSSK